jgi:hypothetical protein
MTPLEALEGKLPRPLRAVPLSALLAWWGIGAIAAIVLIAASLRSAEAIEALEEDESADAGAPVAVVTATASASAPAPKPGPPRASKAEVDAAKLAGVDALFALAQRFPEDRAVLRALFLMQADEKKQQAAAMRTARHLVEIAPDMANDAEFASTLVALANLGANDISAVALDVMAGMGAPGAELLFDVASGQAFFAKTRAMQLLHDKEVRGKATPALLVAADLLESRPCARKAHVERAKNDGDARSLPYLKPLVNPACGGGGGKLGGLFGGGRGGGGECYRCFTPAEKTEIQAAIDAISARSGTPAPSSRDGG